MCLILLEEQLEEIVPYNVQGANHLWHIDTNHKLISWRFVIFGCVDRYSRLPIYLQCTDNNMAATSLEFFLNGELRGCGRM